MLMQLSKKIILCSIFILSALHIPLTLAENQSNNDPGSLIFIYDNGGHCQMEVKNSLHAISFYAGGPGYRGCDKSVKSFRLNHARSAVTIELTSRMRGSNHNGCLETGDFNFYFKFRTVINGATTVPISLRSLADASIGVPLVPGLILKERNFTNKDKLDGYLTCIKITTTE